MWYLYLYSMKKDKIKTWTQRTTNNDHKENNLCTKTLFIIPIKIAIIVY